MLKISLELLWFTVLMLSLLPRCDCVSPSYLPPPWFPSSGPGPGGPPPPTALLTSAGVRRSQEESGVRRSQESGGARRSQQESLCVSWRSREQLPGLACLPGHCALLRPGPHCLHCTVVISTVSSVSSVSTVSSVHVLSLLSSLSSL